jgi:hypothetical protein
MAQAMGEQWKINKAGIWKLKLRDVNVHTQHFFAEITKSKHMFGKEIIVHDNAGLSSNKLDFFGRKQ